MRTRAALLIAVVVAAVPATAQFKGLTDQLDKLKSKKAQIDSKTEKEQKAVKKVAEAQKSWTAEQEEQIGEATAAKLIHTFGLYEEPKLVRYVNLVGNTVAKQAPRGDVQYHFGVLDTMSVNALALPGGFVFVTKGALASLNDEAQLAGVLGHEVAHVDGRHLEHELKNKATTSAGLEYGQAQSQKATAAIASQTGGLFSQADLDKLVN